MASQLELKMRWEQRRKDREFNDEIAALTVGITKLARAIAPARRREPTITDLRLDHLRHTRRLAELRYRGGRS